MAMRTAAEYIESPRRLHLDVCLLGEKIDNWVDHPIIRPSLNSVAMTQTLAAESPELAATASLLAGEKVNRFNSLFQSRAELVSKVKMQREMGRRTGARFQRCGGMDAMNAAFSATFEIDRKRGTD